MTQKFDKPPGLEQKPRMQMNLEELQDYVLEVETRMTAMGEDLDAEKKLSEERHTSNQTELADLRKALHDIDKKLVGES
jgi:hypothetical protein